VRQVGDFKVASSAQPAARLPVSCRRWIPAVGHELKFVTVCYRPSIGPCSGRPPDARPSV